MTRTSRIAAFLIALVAWLPAAPGAAQRCEAPQVLLTIDKSSSMLGELPDGGTKWDAARMAIQELAGAYATSLALGLQVFPYPDRCSPGAVTMDFGTHDPEELVAALGEPPPSGGNYTPMAETLDAAREFYVDRLADSPDNHLILITDGWQYCYPHDSSTRFHPVDAVSRLRDQGVTVHVVGFGAAVDSLTLNRAAVAAGTALPGCDPALSEPSAMNHCYLQANDLVELRAALDGIGRLITDEMCDGIDNDCDGVVDEGYDRDGDGYTVCGSDPTTPGEPDPTAADCDDDEVTVYPGAEELCDGLDNDCDDAIDPGCDCLAGDMRACGSDVGACVSGAQRCYAGEWGVCEGGVMEADGETCDGTDEDCDGAVDEDADASCGEGHVCSTEGCVPTNPPMEPEDMVEPEPEPMPEPTSPPADLVEARTPAMIDAGCACSLAGRRGGTDQTATAGGGLGAGGAAALLALGTLLAVGLRRRRRRG